MIPKLTKRESKLLQELDEEDRPYWSEKIGRWRDTPTSSFNKNMTIDDIVKHIKNRREHEKRMSEMKAYDVGTSFRSHVLSTIKTGRY